MKKKIFALLALVMTVMTASAIDAPSFELKKAQGAEAHGTITFKVGENTVTSAAEGQTVTVIITPNTGWVVNAPAGLWGAAIAATRSTDDPVEMLKDFELEPVEGNPNAFTFTMERADAEISCKYKKLLTHTDITVADIAALTYTGSALEPVVTVKDGQTTMTLWNAQTQTGDYTVSYSNNVNAAQSTAGDKAPTVTITAVESSELYSGSTTKTFTINPKALEDGFIANIDALVYNGVAQTPEPAVTYNSMTLAKGTDFTYSYVNNILNAESTDNNAPKLTITAVTPGNYSGSASKTFTIEQKAITADLVDPIEAVTYNGTAFKPAPVLTYNEMTLEKDVDYTVAYANNVEAGTADVIITGMGHYTSAATVHFTIHKGNIEIEAPKAIEELVYNGEAQALVIAGKAIGGEMQYSLDGTTYTATLPTGTDAKEYTVHYKAVGDKNHDDRPGSNFKVSIAPAELTAVTLEETNLVYNQEEQTVQIATVSAGTLTVPAAGYEVSGNKATVVDNYTITVKGKGNFKGEATAQWSIVTAGTQALDITVDPASVVYDGTEQKPAVIVKDGATVLKEGTDYTVSYSNNVDAGTATVTMTGKGNYEGTKTAEFTIGKATLTVTAEDATVFFGNELPAFTVSYEGFVNGETEDVLSGTLAFACDYTTESPEGSTFAITPSGLTSDNYDIIFVDGTLTVVVDQNAPYKETLQTAIAIASNINPEALADAIAAAQAAMTAEDATAESLTQANQTLETAIKAYLGEILPGLGAIVEGLNDETLNAAYADAEAALAKEDVTLQELVAAMQQIIAAAQDVAPEHLQNLKEYAVKYGAEDAATLIDAALEAIESGNVSQIIATMTAVKEAATPLAEQVLGTMINYVQAFGLTEQAAQAQAALESGNYITMITTAKELFSHLIAAAKEYLPKLGAIAEGLNDETLNSAYAAAQALLAKESITPEELGAAMQQIIAAAQDVAPEHLQNLKEYAEKYGAEDAATLIDAALEAIESGNVSQIIATMTAVKEAATPLATAILTQMIEKAQSYTGFEEDITEAQAALESGNYITMITAAKALYAKLQAADQAAADAVIALIEAIGDVEYTPESKAKIDAAREAFEALTDEQKKLVNNYGVQTDAEEKYAELEAVVTGVGSMKAAFEKDVWYDLNGHKLNGKPTKKGVYFINGKKVVI